MVDIQNHTPRVDVNGDVIDCHDGCLRFFEDAYYLYGTAYGDTDGFVKTNHYVVYRSPDLERWTACGEMLDAPLDGVCYRPYVVRRPSDGKYVAWFNWYPVLWEGQFGVAVADDPAGPFTVAEPNVKVAQPKPGDHNVFVDDDDTGYLVYTSIPDLGQGDHGMSVERLDGTLMNSTGENSGLFDFKVEAPSLFKRGGVYFALFGNTCCFCPEGAGAKLWRAEDPLGPWMFVKDINRDEGGSVVVPAQQTDITCLPGADGGEDVWLFMGDKWGSRPDGIKGHDLQHWEPLVFGADGLPARLTNGDAFAVDVKVS